MDANKRRWPFDSRLVRDRFAQDLPRIIRINTKKKVGLYGGYAEVRQGRTKNKYKVLCRWNF
jgi:hypothetical protein